MARVRARSRRRTHGAPSPDTYPAAAAAARGPATRRCAYPGNSGSAGGPSLGTPRSLNAPFAQHHEPASRSPHYPPSRRAHADATRSAAPAPLAGLGNHGCRALQTHPLRRIGEKKSCASLRVRLYATIQNMGQNVMILPFKWDNSNV